MAPEYVSTAEFARYVDAVDRRHASMDEKLDQVLTLLQQERVEYEHRMTTVEQRLLQAKATNRRSLSIMSAGISSVVVAVVELLHRVLAK